MFGLPTHQIVVAVLLGVASGVYIFKPYMMKRQQEKETMDCNATKTTAPTREQAERTKGSK